MGKFTFVFAALFCLSAFTQENYNFDSYRVTLNDLKSNSYEKDSTATALVIYEYGNSFFDPNDYVLKTEVKRKVKFLKREGFDKATVTIMLYNNDSSKEKVSDIVATSYNLEGENVITTKLEDVNIFRETYDENHSLVKFTLPNIKEGSVINYSYTITSPFMFNYKGWVFQEEIPKLYSGYRTSIPANYEYNIKLVGNLPLAEQESSIKPKCLSVRNPNPRPYASDNYLTADCSEAFYVMRDIPAFIDEDYLTARKNYLSRVDYELKTFKMFDGRVENFTKSWETVDDELKKEETIGRQLSKSVDIEDLLPQQIMDEKDALKKASLIYNFIQQQYTWNGEYHIFRDASIKDLIKNKSGNASSINILLHNVLEEAGIEVKPVLLSTRNNGFATKIFPVISEFNYLIVQATINNQTFLLDATDKYLSFGQIPFRCLNQYGRLLDFKNGSEWIDIVPNELSRTLYNASINIDDSKFSGKISSKRTGYHAFNLKKKYFQSKEAYIDDLEDNYTNMEISNYESTSEDITNPDFTEAYDIELVADFIGDNIYLNPFFINFFNENPFKLQQRSYPIDFGYKDSYYYLISLTLGNNYSFIELPEDFIIGLPNNSGMATLSSKLIGNTLNLTFKIDFKEALYPPEFYPYLKEFMNKIVDAQKNATIVLKKT